jgi:hypothetical protein
MKSTRLPTGTIPLPALTSQTHLCARTDEGRIAEFWFDIPIDLFGMTIVIRYETWDEPAPTPAPQVTASPAAQAPLTAAQAWSLDFDRSGLSPVVCLGFEGSTCTNHGELGSSLKFKGQRVEGNTGVGGGCDEFTGTFKADAKYTGSLAVTIPTYPSRCWDTGADLEIRNRLNHAASYTVANGLLTVLDADGLRLLVYRTIG